MSTVTEWEVLSMADIVSVGFRVDTSQIDKGYKRLDRMGDSASKTEGRIGKMAKGAKSAGTAIAGMSTAAIASTTAIAALMNHLANVERELQASARMAGLTADQFEAMSFAYRQFGLTVEQVNDTYKDSRERIGEWLNSQSGALQDFGDAMGMSKDEITAFAREVDGLNGQQLLQRMVNDLEGAGVSGNQLSGVMEAMASEATRMIPALENNGQAVRSLSNEYVRFNSAFSLNDEDVQNYADLSKNFDLFLDTAQNGMTKTLSPLAEVMSVLAMETAEFLASLQEGSVISAENRYADALAEQLEARRLLGEAQNIPAAFGQDVIDQETKIAQARLDAANMAVASADKQLEAAKKTAQAQLEVNRTSTRNVNVRLSISEIEEREKAAEKARKALEQQAIAYDRWLESVRASADPVSVLQNEITELWMAMLNGDLSTEIATKRIEQLNKEIKDLQETKNPYEEMSNGAMEYLTAIQMLSSDGSDDFKDLERAMAALSVAQSIAAGNIAGVIASSASLITSFDRGLGGDISAQIQANQNLDAWGEKADSISTSTEITASATEKLVGINTKMLDALKAVRTGIANASGIISQRNTGASVNVNRLGIMSNIFTDNFIGGFISEGMDLFNSLTFNVLGSITGGIFDAVGSFFGGSSKVKDEGIRIIGGSLVDLLDDVTVEAFQTIKYKKWRFGSSKRKTKTVDLGGEVSNQVSLVFESIVDSVIAGAESIGISDNKISQAINSFIVDTTSISLKDLSKDEQKKEIEAYFSGVFNELATAVVPFLDDFQQAGEELGETLSRLSAEVSIADYLVDVLGVSINSKLSNPEAFVAAADNIAMLSGGVESLADKTSSFINAFATDSQKFDIYENTLSEALDSVGIRLPETAEGFYDLMRGINASSEEGQNQIATILSLTDTAKGYYDLLEREQDKQVKEAESMIDSFRNAASSMFEVSKASRMMSIDTALAAARLGDFSLAESLNLGSIRPVEDDFSSMLAFNIARAETAAKLNEIADIRENQIPIEVKQLTVLEQIRDKLGNGDTMSQSKLSEKIGGLEMTMKKLITESNDYLRRSAYQGA